MTADTKTALLDCAEHAARARGYDGFSYADMAKAVGIRKASIHYHFPTKADLSVALMARYHDHLEQACAAIEVAHKTGADRLLAMIEVYREASNAGKTLCLCVAFSASRGSLSDPLIHKIQDFRTMVIGWLQDVFTLGAKDGTIADVGDPESEAFAMLALLEGALLTARSDEDIRFFDAATETVKSRCRA